MTPAIVGLRARTRAVLAAEVERSLSGKLRHLSAADRDALGVMIEAATNKLLHGPVTRLKAMAADPRAGDYLEALRELFDLPELASAPEHPCAAPCPDDAAVGAISADGAERPSRHAPARVGGYAGMALEENLLMAGGPASPHGRTRA